MAIAPGDQRKIALAVRAIYDEAELEILQLIARRLAKGMANNDWAYKRITEINILQQQVQGIITNIDRKIDSAVEDAIMEAYELGRASIDDDLNRAIRAGVIHDVPLETGMSFSGLATRGVSTLAKATVTGLRGSHLQIIRSVNDIYRQTINQTSAHVLAGTHSVQQAVQQSLNRFSDQGVSGFMDKAGRRWDLGAYSEMSIRTNSAHAAVEGAIGRMQQRGHNLVVVSNHSRECNLCRPWEGKILDASNSNADGKKNLRDATSAGLFHPNCKHTLTAYIAGYTKIPYDTEDPVGYEQAKKEREAERNIRKWMKRMQVAITPDERTAARTRFEQWTNALNKLKSEYTR